MTCAHIAGVAGPEPDPVTPAACTGCAAEGRTDWVHLRLCLTCGYVGCCDSSPRKHATEHAGAQSHPVVRSYEPGETWRWCFVDEIVG